MKLISYLGKPSVVPDHVQNILICFLPVDNTNVMVILVRLITIFFSLKLPEF